MTRAGTELRFLALRFLGEKSEFFLRPRVLIQAEGGELR